MRSGQFIIDVMDLIKERRLHGIAVGDSIESVRNVFGMAELPKSRIGRRSKLHYHLYGNLSFVSEDEVVVSINIDLHGNRMRVVDVVDEGRGVDEWMAFFSENKWNVRRVSEIISASSNGVSLDFLPSGKLGMISLT
ncbi:hypothetical protein [Burkholderia sp. MSMB617WGS]|uniref:hypothetical protein n=1 Tax=Burkholderia sp. MSMB617WGS TaxID=1637831 RepID=UPI0011AE69FB|nr:hypothetical protein [Burkholderia sp. MSMB617WGS]